MYSLLGYENENNPDTFVLRKALINQSFDKVAQNFLAQHTYDIYECIPVDGYNNYIIHCDNNDCYIEIRNIKMVKQLLDNLELNSIDSNDMQTVLGYVFKKLKNNLQ